MRLALIRQRYTAFGGAERFIERAMQALAVEGGVSLTLITREWNTGALNAAHVMRCNPFFLGRTWRDWSFARAACALVSRGDFDLVQAHERLICCDIYRAGDGVHAQWLANRWPTLGPLQRLAQAASPWHRYTLAAERRLFTSPRLKAVICNSNMVAAELRSHFGLDAGKVRVIHNGVDLERFHPALRAEWRETTRKRLGIQPGAIVYLFLGSGFERKGLEQLLEACARLPDRSRHLIVVGADRKAGVFETRSRALGLEGRVHFMGAQKDPGPWYAAADCFVLPTLYDPFPNAVLEAMACGLPVITSTQSGAAELIAAATHGWVCDALDVPALARHMSAVDAEGAARMGRAARSVAEQFPLETMAKKLVALYRDLMGAASQV